jgi:DNA/RNA endonuclease YhcR with UshA esterase domain
VFTALILGTDRAKFGEPEKTLRGKQVCVTGQIRLYDGAAQVILTEPDQMHERGSTHAGP